MLWNQYGPLMNCNSKRFSQYLQHWHVKNAPLKKPTTFIKMYFYTLLKIIIFLPCMPKNNHFPLGECDADYSWATVLEQPSSTWHPPEVLNSCSHHLQSAWQMLLNDIVKNHSITHLESAALKTSVLQQV